MLNGLGVVSASHDQTLRVWTFDGKCIGTLIGHTALVYRRSSHPSDCCSGLGFPLQWPSLSRRVCGVLTRSSHVLWQADDLFHAFVAVPLEGLTAQLLQPAKTTQHVCGTQTAAAFRLSSIRAACGTWPSCPAETS